MVKDSLVCWFPVNLNAGAVVEFNTEVKSDANWLLPVSLEFHWQTVYKTAITSMRCNWTGLEPVAFPRGSPNIFTSRPKRNLVNAPPSPTLPPRHHPHRSVFGLANLKPSSEHSSRLLRSHVSVPVEYVYCIRLKCRQLVQIFILIFSKNQLKHFPHWKLKKIKYN